jgi:hypothetical protein
MGLRNIMAGWTGNAVLAGLVLGCAGADGLDGGGGEPVPARTGTGSARVAPAVIITEIHADHLANRHPRFISLAPKLAREGEPYHYGISALEPDGEEVHLTLVRAPEGAALEGMILKWTPEHAQAGHRQRFTLRAVDDHGAAVDQTWTVVPRLELRPGSPAESGGRH